MDPFVVNPASYDKKASVLAALDYVTAFLDLNDIEHVNEVMWSPDDTKKPPGKNPWHDKGWYWFGNLFVNLKKSRVPVKNPGFSWSYTGFKADLTAPGILAHEVGHHVHFVLDRKHGSERARETLERLKNLSEVEAPVSGYEPNAHELFAEAMRLFILNPLLLKEGRPQRYKLLTDLGLKPLHQAPWREVLVHAHPRIISAAEAWIKL